MDFVLPVCSRHENKTLTVTFDLYDLHIDSCVCFTWPIRKEGAYKQATRGTTALGPLRGIEEGNEDQVICPRALLLI